MGCVFGDPVAASAMLDRLVHRSTVITIRSDSYWLRSEPATQLLHERGAVLHFVHGVKSLVRLTPPASLSSHPSS
ncbi:ATP-binding protein [Aurantiacibacter zhengii]|uniref:ATP-binding protein n=1 Tax=Erythrobacteraceae TaxID=335929 RepID=UPI0038996C85